MRENSHTPLLGDYKVSIHKMWKRKKVKDNPIKLYYYKKKAQPNIVPKVALFACVNKLIRMIHSLCKSGLIYEYSITQK